MPLYEHKLTGKTATLSEDYVAGLPAGTFKKVADESPSEAAERDLRERQEAAKVTYEDADGNDLDAPFDPLPAPGKVLTDEESGLTVEPVAPAPKKKVAAKAAAKDGEAK